ncbi:MAG: CcoQ/FixQ family Cbb3-type cytochrome c oxidase assembly chaperone [Burkholderiales bacterium]|nr:CcoQ/FixQ family Cbb3-type cytochrome c oxidase assembly chaperone [Burkholderiales bacterium]
MDINLMRATFTVVSLCIFVGIVFWAYGRNRHAEFEEAAQLPLADD